MEGEVGEGRLGVGGVKQAEKIKEQKNKVLQKRDRVKGWRADG